MPKNLALIPLFIALTLPAFATDKHVHPAPIRRSDRGNRWAEKTLHKLTLEEKAGLDKSAAAVKVPELAFLLTVPGGKPNPWETQPSRSPCARLSLS